MDGVAFLDASVGTFGGLSEDFEPVNGDTDATWTGSESEWDLESLSADSHTADQRSSNSCNVLGCAMSVCDGDATELEAQPARKMTEIILRTLLRRCPRGKIWTSDRYGDTFDDERSSDDEEVLQDHTAHQRKLRRRERLHDGEMLQSMFPGVRTVALHGVRDGHGRRFTAGCLLWSFDALLDFASLKGRRLARGSASSTSINHMLAGRRVSVQGDVAGMDSSIGLDDLTEEATESTVFSYFCSKNAEERARISVVMDIDRSADIDWSCTLASGGWRRICMNLINNALKYTDSGYVRISMHQKKTTRQTFEAVLTIADTGKGMSHAFVNEDLSRDFTQEDANADGVGLGMNVVGQIMNAMGVLIEVKTDQQGTGTCVVVKVPLKRNQRSESRSMSNVGHTSENFPRGLDVGIVLNSQERRLFMTDRQEQLEITASSLAIQSIEKTCRSLGLEARTGQWADCSATKLNFVLEEDFSKQVDLMQNDSDAGSKCVIGSIPSVVICKNSPSAQTIKEVWRNHPHHPGIITEHIASPCGILTISRAISSALQRHKTFQESQAAHLDESNEKRQSQPATRTVSRNLDDLSDSHTESRKPRVLLRLRGWCRLHLSKRKTTKCHHRRLIDQSTCQKPMRPNARLSPV